MRDAVGPIYNTLYDVIAELASDLLNEFTRGFWYFGENCTKDASLFPYAYLDQPRASRVEIASNPNGYKYTVSIPLVTFTLASGDRTALYFNETLGDNPEGAVEICHNISRAVWRNYIHGLPFSSKSPGWSILSWTLGDLGKLDSTEHRQVEAAGFLENPNIAAAVTSFNFTVKEDGPLPYNTHPALQ